MIKGDDVFFERDSAREGNPALVALNAGAGDGEPLVQFLGLADEGPHFVGAAVNEVAATDRTHGSKLTVNLAENGTQAIAQLISDWL